MPRIRLTLPGTGVPWTKVPNRVVDGLMPTLRDTELRVLLVLLRQTSGWNREGAPVTVPYRRLTLLTGRGSEAVANALSSLRDRGLIHAAGTLAPRFPKPGAPESEPQQTKTE